MKPKIKYQQFTLNVPAAGAVIPIDEETDKLYNKVTGINIVITDSNNIFSTLALQINTVEVFPDGFEIIRILFRPQVPFGYEYHELNEKAGGSRVKGTFTDVNTGAAYPYKVIISLRLENEEGK
ncbi:MAG TPA: hypothetical protein VN026_10745 [Bacteroidia bacterium]|jgi:hypothetical protein|nr:hypothetical protein [Bacteroidia bacterium]